MRKPLLWAALLLVFPFFILGGFAVYFVKQEYANLPSIDVITHYDPALPLRIYTDDKVLIGEFGQEKREIYPLAKIPKHIINALVSVEDTRFFEHQGVDWKGAARALVADLKSGSAKEGASTITMQLARNFYLSRERTAHRKFKEVLLAYKIEKSLTKDQILESYLNYVYLGQGAYGFGAAARVYFGISLDQVTLAEAAMLAGLPKAPSAYNPVTSYQKAKIRQAHVLRRMQETGKITEDERKKAEAEVITVHASAQEYAVDGRYPAELVRQSLYAQYGEDAYSSGFDVYTTINSYHQQVATNAVVQNLIALSFRGGYSGPLDRIPLPAKIDDPKEYVPSALSRFNSKGPFVPAIISQINVNGARIYLKDGTEAVVPKEGLTYVKDFVDNKNPTRLSLMRGAVVMVYYHAVSKTYYIAQVPGPEAAFVSLNPYSGAVYTMVGGMDYSVSSFNRVVQAERQPGSSFKPFVYSASLEHGFTPATLLEDSLIESLAAQEGEDTWRPQNYDGAEGDVMSLREAFYRSKNLVSIRVLSEMDIDTVLSHVAQFGINKDKQPRNLTLALGAGAVTPMEMARAYAVFSNGGFLVEPYLVNKIVSRKTGKIVFQHTVAPLDEKAQRIPSRNAFIITDILKDVTHIGTAAKAGKLLNRTDIAGKTGTTNDQKDAWFAGFQDKGVVAVSWVGYDTPKPLGKTETGGQTALPVWIDYMAYALKGVPETPVSVPPGISIVPIDPSTGEYNEEGHDEYFYSENAPDGTGAGTPGSANKADYVPLFDGPSSEAPAVPPLKRDSAAPPAQSPIQWNIVN